MNKYVNQTLIFGLAGGFACFLWFIIVYYAGANPFYSFSQKLVILLQAVICYIAIRYFREKYFNDAFSFGEGILCGLLVTVLLSVFCSVMVYAFIEIVDPEMVVSHIAELKKYLIENKKLLVDESSIDVYEGNFKNVDGVTTYTLVLDEFIWKIIRGLMFTILSSLTLRRSKV